MKILFIHPPQLNVLDNKQDPPLGLLYLAAILEKNGVNVKILDLGGVPENLWEKNIEKADIYGITCYTASLTNTQKISNLIKKNYPESYVIIGGAHPSALPEETIKYKNFDIVVKGEAENIIFDIVNNIKDYKNNIINSNPIQNLDKIPFPARHLINIYEYSRKVLNRKATNMITGRGCPYKCAFCYKGLYGNTVRLRSAENVIKESEFIVENYNIKAFHFLDDIFTLNKKRLNKILDAFEKMDIWFRCNSRAGLESLEDFEKLYKGGCKEIAFGIESGSQKILDKINKCNTVESNKIAILNAKKVGIRTKAYLIIGLPGETEETIEETKKFIEETKPDSCSLYTFIPYPGTSIWNNPELYDIEIINKNFDDYYIIDTNSRGGITIKLNTITNEKLIKLRENFLYFLKGIYENKNK